DRIKEAERSAQAEAAAADGFDRLPRGLPALLRAQRVADKAAKSDDNPPRQALVDDVQISWESLRQAAAAPEISTETRTRLEQNLGELLFQLCRLARVLDINAEDSLRGCTGRIIDEKRERKKAEQA